MPTKGARGRILTVYRVSAPFRLPTWLALCTVIAYWITPESTFLSQWRVPKLASGSDLLYYVSALAIFCVSSVVGAAFGKPPKSQAVRAGGRHQRILQQYTSLGLIGAVLGYLVWGCVGISRAGGIAQLVEARRSNPYYVKSVLLDTIPGVTTLTQVAVLAIPVWYVLKCGRRLRREFVTVGLLILFAFIRSQLFLERLAIIELVLPLGFLAVCQRRLSVKRMALYVVALLVVTLVFFTGSELTRSLSNLRSYEGRSIIEAGTMRFAGYYLTSINNGVLSIREGATLPLWNTFRMIWRFPGMEGLYSHITGLSVEPSSVVLSRAGLNPEFNTSTAIGAWAADFGFFGGLVWALIIGMVSGALWALGVRDHLLRAFYAVWLVGELELMRIEYFSGTRLFPAYVFWVGAVLLRSVARERGQDICKEEARKV